MIAIAVLALAACSTPSDVVKTGPDAYRIRTESGAGASRKDADIKAYGTKRAAEFCEAEGKHAVITVGQSSEWHLFSFQTAEVRFTCDDLLPVKPAAKSATP
ncbi:MAG: hypothetical protein ABJA61_08655 [Caldimonas sp.]